MILETARACATQTKHKNGRALFSMRGEIRLCSQGTTKRLAAILKISVKLLYSPVSEYVKFDQSTCRICYVHFNVQKYCSIIGFRLRDFRHASCTL